MFYLGVSVLAYALNNVLWKRMLSSFAPSILLTVRAFFTSVIGLLVAFSLYNNVLVVSQTDFLRSMIASVIGALGLFFMLSALKQGTLKLLALYNLFTVFITASFLFIFDDLDVVNYGYGSFLMLSGYFLFFFHSNKQNLKFPIAVHLKFALMSLLFAASGLMHWYNLLENVHPVFIAANQEIVVLILGLCLVKLNGYKMIDIKKVLHFKHLRFIFLMALVIFVAVYFGLLGMLQSNPFILSLTSLAVPILTFFFGVWFFREKFTLQSIIALTAMVTAAYLLR